MRYEIWKEGYPGQEDLFFGTEKLEEALEKAFSLVHEYRELQITDTKNSNFVCELVEKEGYVILLNCEI